MKAVRFASPVRASCSACNANFLFCPFEGRDITAHTHDDAGWRNTFAHLQPSSIAQALRSVGSVCGFRCCSRRVPEPPLRAPHETVLRPGFLRARLHRRRMLSEGRADMHGRRRIRIELPVCRVAQQKPVILIERGNGIRHGFNDARHQFPGPFRRRGVHSPRR